MVDPDGRVAQCKSILINYWYEYDGMHLIHQSYHDECTGGTYPGRGGGGQLPPGEPKPNAEAGTSDELIAEQGVDPEPKSDPPGECLPSGPNGASIDANIERTKAEVMTLGLPVAQWLWINRVRPGGIWDYKVDHGTSAENFGNANYGATANALGFSLNITHRAAGAVQYFAGAWKPYMGTPAGSAPFGDDVSDYFYTGKGWTYGQEGGCK